MIVWLLADLLLLITPVTSDFEKEQKIEETTETQEISEEKKKFKKALLEIDEDLEFSDVRRKADDILKYASVNDLFDRINKVVLLNRRNYIVNGIINDYIKCMKVINENASLYLDDSKAYLKKLTEDREYDQSQIEKIEQSNRDIEILQGKIRKIRRNLEIEISANSENIIVR